MIELDGEELYDFFVDAEDLRARLAGRTAARAGPAGR